MDKKTSLLKAMGFVLGLATASITTLTAEEIKTEKPAITGDIRYYYVEENQKDFIETNFNYSLPGEIKTHSFVDMNQNGGYFGKTTLVKKLKGDFSARARVIHGNEFFSSAGAGVQISHLFNTSNLPFVENVFTSVDYIPLWFDGKNKIEHKSTLAGLISVKFPKGFGASIYGRANPEAINGAEWEFVNPEISKTFKNGLKIAYSPIAKTKPEALKIKGIVNIGYVGYNF